MLSNNSTFMMDENLPISSQRTHLRIVSIDSNKEDKKKEEKKEDKKNAEMEEKKEDKMELPRKLSLIKPVFKSRQEEIEYEIIQCGNYRSLKEAFEDRAEKVG